MSTDHLGGRDLIPSRPVQVITTFCDDDDDDDDDDAAADEEYCMGEENWHENGKNLPSSPRRLVVGVDGMCPERLGSTFRVS